MALRQACLTPPRSAGTPASADRSIHASFLSAEMVPPPPRFRHPLVAHTLPCGPPAAAPSSLAPATLALPAPALEPFGQVFGSQSNSKFANVLGSISSLFSEVHDEERALDEYLQRFAEESGRSAEDYERRAVLFERSGEMVASSKLKGERVLMELEVLQGEVLECDDGRTAVDYLRRAQIFSKSAEVFGS